MTRLPFIQMFTGEELAAIQFLKTVETGAYFLLTMTAWEHAGLPRDDSRLARIARVTDKEWAGMRDILMPFFDGWDCTRLLEKRSKAEETHRRKSEAGRKGGRPSRQGHPAFTARDLQGQEKPSFSSHSHNHSHNQKDGAALMKKPSSDGQTEKLGDIFHPAVPDEQQAIDWLAERNVFPGDVDTILPKLMEGRLRRDELQALTTH